MDDGVFEVTVKLDEDAAHKLKKIISEIDIERENQLYLQSKSIVFN